MSIFKDYAEIVGNYEIKSALPDRFGNKRWYLNCQLDQSMHNTPTIQQLLFIESPASALGDDRGTLFDSGRNGIQFRFFKRGDTINIAMSDLLLTYRNGMLDFSKNLHIERKKAFEAINWKYDELPEYKVAIIALLESMLHSGYLYEFEPKEVRDRRRDRKKNNGQ